jgi:hypothetical protein
MQGSMPQLKVFPVPAGSILNVELPQKSNSDIDASIIDVSGKVISAVRVHVVNGSFIIETKDLQAGIYFLQCYSKEFGSYTARFVKE